MRHISLYTAHVHTAVVVPQCHTVSYASHDEPYEVHAHAACVNVERLLFLQL